MSLPYNSVLKYQAIGIVGNQRGGLTLSVNLVTETWDGQNGNAYVVISPEMAKEFGMALIEYAARADALDPTALVPAQIVDE